MCVLLRHYHWPLARTCINASLRGLVGLPEPRGIRGTKQVSALTSPIKLGRATAPKKKTRNKKQETAARAKELTRNTRPMAREMGQPPRRNSIAEKPQSCCHVIGPWR